MLSWVAARMNPALGALLGTAPVVRTPHEQARVDARTARWRLYQYAICPYCSRVQRALRRLALSIPTRDTRHDPQARAELLHGGGIDQVPCLRIEHEDGRIEWLYESADIVAYLEREFPAPPATPEPAP